MHGPRLSKEAAVALHNRSVPKVLDVMVTEPLDAGGSTGDVLAICESALVHMALTILPLGGDDQVLDAIFVRAKARLARIRLETIPFEGRA